MLLSWAKYLLRVGWRNFFSSCAVVSVFGSGRKQVLVYVLMYLEYHTVVVLCHNFLLLVGNSFWYVRTYLTVVVLCQFILFWPEIVFGVTYVHSVQYKCAVVFLKNDYLVSLFLRNNLLAKTYFSSNPNFLLLHISFLFFMNQHCYNHDCFSKILRSFCGSKN